MRTISILALLALLMPLVARGDEPTTIPIHIVTAQATVGGKPITQKQKVVVGTDDATNVGHP